LLPPVLGRVGPEFQQARFLGMQFQSKRPKPLGEFDPEPLGCGARRIARATRGRAYGWLRPGRNPYEKPRKSVS
jgi:hypothetical protein